MSLVVVSGAGGLVGSESVRHFSELGCDVVGIDNDLRSYFFGADGSTVANVKRLRADVPGYEHLDIDIRDRDAVGLLFRRLGKAVSLVVHAAGQPSHDWAALEPLTDFEVNAVGTLNVLESVRASCPDATVAFMSTNKVYGDTPNRLPFIELDTRWAVDPSHPWARGIPEEMTIDSSLHSLFGVSKTAADLMVQQYGRYFGLRTVCFRSGTITGSAQAAAELHGFLAYLVRCAREGRSYTIHGYKGKQVRDAIHGRDFARAIEAFWANPRPAAVYNMGGGAMCNCSVLEAIELVEKVTGRSVAWDYDDTARVGDHLWWISDLSAFERDFPTWRLSFTLEALVEEIADARPLSGN